MSEEMKNVEVPAKFQALVESIEKMSVLDLSELVKVLEEKFGVSAAAPAMMMAAPAAAGAAAAEEQSSFTVEITSAGENKINVIKAYRSRSQGS
jgi:large subunit ribosomal protein L7/L12